MLISLDFSLFSFQGQHGATHAVSFQSVSWEWPVAKQRRDPRGSIEKRLVCVVVVVLMLLMLLLVIDDV